MAGSQTDALVIGAGVIGSAVAFELARRGRSVTCVDAGPAVGSGSTSASSAIIRFHYSTLDSVITAWESAAVWPRLADYLGVADEAGMVRFVRTGCLILDSPGHNRQRVLTLLADVGVPYEELTADDIARRWPDLDTGDYSPPRPVDDPEFGADAHGTVGGYYTPDAGFVDDPALAASNFAFAARHHGAVFRLRTRVTGIRVGGGRVTGVDLESGETIGAPVVVNAAGPGSERINAMAGVTDEMTISHRSLRQEVHVTESPTGFDVEDGTIVTDLGLGTYFRPHLGGSLLTGGTESPCDPFEWVDDPDHYDDHPTLAGFERNVFRMARRLPTVGIPHRPVGLAALYDVADDWVPIYDKSGLDGFFMACATSGNQFKNAPMAGIFLAELIEAAERGQDHDVDPVRVRGGRTGRSIDLSAFSRLRTPAATTGTVMG